ncbi:MAG: KAP family NTPase [Prevotella sp.]|nr:KAP family NTPase [Prevotella sp.]
MTIKELKNNLLKSLYSRYKDNKTGAIQLTELCKENNLIYDSLSQLSSAAKSLKDSGYINATFFVGGDALIMTLTAAGIEYVEENLLSQEDLVIDGLNDTSKEFANNPPAIDIDIDSKSETDNGQESYIGFTKVFTPEERNKSIKDSEVEPCFSINDVASCFINQLDKIADSKSENIPMIGVFAPWGRGKSYFLNLIFQQLESRKEKWYHSFFGRNTTKNYKIIKFNAWKYKDTPAIWAYLYETIYHQTSWWQKCWLYIKKNVLSYKFLLLTLLILFFWLIGYLLNKYTSILDAVSNLKAIGGIGTIVTVVLSFVLTLKDNPISALKIIQKYTRRKSYNDCLGIQNAIESDLEDLLGVLQFKKDRVLLCVDDIDRCSTEKMVNIVDSLRTVLENDIIRDRLIVICSIDIEKLMHGYRSMYKDFISESEEVIREQIDKVFIFSLGLAKLGPTQLDEYLRKLLEINDSDSSTMAKETLFDTDRQEDALYIANSDETPIKLSDIEMYRAINEFVQKNKSSNITPRKLRIMYYQLLFANNLASKRGVTLTEKLIDNLLEKSLTGIEQNIHSQALGDIIEMAVPY